MKKKIISGMLSLTLVFGLLSIQTFSADNAEENYQDSVISELQEKQIVLGDEYGNLMNTSPITREQMVSVIGRIKELSDSRIAGLEVYCTDYSDVSDWAYSYVLEGYENEFVSGYPDGSFKPQQEMTYEEAVKFALCAGAGKTESEVMFNSYDYPEDYINKADSEGYLYGSGNYTFGTPMAREDVFTLIYNIFKTEIKSSNISATDNTASNDFPSEDLTMGGTLTNPEDFSDEDSEAIIELLDMGAISVDDNGKFNPDEIVSTEEANAGLSNFVESLNENYGVSLPVESLPKLNGEKVTAEDVAEALDTFTKNFDTEEEIKRYLKNPVTVTLPSFEWREGSLQQLFEDMHISNPAVNLTKNAFMAILKNWYTSYKNWTTSYTVTLNGAGNHNSRIATYDGTSYYYFAPYTDDSGYNKMGLFKENNNSAKLLDGGGSPSGFYFDIGGLCEYGDYVYYTSYPSLYRVNKNAKYQKELLSKDVYDIYADGDTLYYSNKSKTEINSIRFDQIHSADTFEANSKNEITYSGTGGYYTEDLIVEDGYAYAYGFNNDLTGDCLKKQNLKTEEVTEISGSTIIKDGSFINIVDENIYLRTSNSLGGSFGGTAIYKVLNEESGTETHLTGYDNSSDSGRINCINAYNGWVYFLLRPNTGGNTHLCKIDYNGTNLVELTELLDSSDIGNLGQLAVAGDYAFVTGRSAEYDIFKIDLRDLSVKDFLPSNVDTHEPTLNKTDSQIITWYPTCPSCGKTDMFIDPSTGLYMCRQCDFVEPYFETILGPCKKCNGWDIHTMEKNGYIYARCYDCGDVQKYNK